MNLHEQFKKGQLAPQSTDRGENYAFMQIRTQIPFQAHVDLGSSIAGEPTSSETNPIPAEHQSGEPSNQRQSGHDPYIPSPGFQPPDGEDAYLRELRRHARGLKSLSATPDGKGYMTPGSMPSAVPYAAVPPSLLLSSTDPTSSEMGRQAKDMPHQLMELADSGKGQPQARHTSTQEDPREISAEATEQGQVTQFQPVAYVSSNSCF